MDDTTGWWLDEADHDRFWAHVNRHGGTDHLEDPLASAEGECWEWHGWSGAGGYGRFRLHGKGTPAHRIAYLDGGRKNTIPDGWVVDHLCRNTRCVNPTHLEPVARDENIDRGKRGRGSHPACPSGHLFSEENTKWVTRRGRQIRYCRICLAASKHKTYLRRKAQAA